jgi:hypothetical protein
MLKSVVGLSVGLLCAVAAEPSVSLGSTAGATKMSIVPAAIAADHTSQVTVRMPATAQTGALHIFLNGTNVTSRFASTSCPSAQCLVAQLGPTDGLRQGKNVFQAEAKSESGAAISARARFDARSPAQISAQLKAATQAIPGSASVAAAQANAAEVAEPFMEPTVGFKTNSAGGYGGQNSWFTVGSTGYPVSAPSGCSGSNQWTVVVLDRQSLSEKTSAPETSPRCFSSNSALASYLKSLPNGDLVIAGTNQNNTVDQTSALDTSAIGGTAYGTVAKNPSSYMIVGATGTTPGTAYEAQFGANQTGWAVLARGILQEDANGDYNFMSGDGDFVRFAVVPNSPAGNFNIGNTPTSSIALSMTAAQHDNNPTMTYMAYAPPAGTDGFWLFTLSRGNLERANGDCGAANGVGGTFYFQNCGTFYATNTTTHGPANGVAAMKQLASDLQKISNDSSRLIFLTTVGKATCCSATSALGLTGYGDTGYAELHDVLEAVGGTPAYTTYGLSQSSTDTGYTPAYTLVTANGLGNPVSGPVVESSTVLLSSNGQTGTVAGTLERDTQNGFFTPGQINQEYTNLLIQKGGLDNEFVLNTTALQAPVDWPAESATQLLPGADSLDGQMSAYRFVSLSLLRDRYAVGISGSHQDDLHYFFTGSLNSSIDYHIFDPNNLPWPGSNASGFTACTSVTPGTGGNDTCTYQFATNDALTFTKNDFNAVISQTSLEVRYLTNVLQYMVSGSTNMRDSIIGGNANVGLALTGAAASVLGNQLLPPPPTTVVNISWESILGMINGGLTIAAGIPGVAGVLTDTTEWGAKELKAVTASGAWSNELAGAAGLASGAGGIKSSYQTNPLPSKYAKFSQTIGELASGSLQDQLAHGFDAAVDSITSDWGRIATIGPRIVNVDDPAFFVPNQVVQEVVLDAMSAGAQRTFYGALMPIFLQVHYWPSVSSDPHGQQNGVQQPDMGYYSSHTEAATCYAFYLTPSENSNTESLGTIPPYVSVYTPRPAGMPSYFTLIFPADTDYYLLAKAPTAPGSDSETITTIDPQLGQTLFSPQGLAIPMLQFMHPNGPMATVFENAGTSTTITTHHNSQICNSSVYTGSQGAVGGTTSSPPPALIDPSIVKTTTELTAPNAAVVGSNVAMTATVTAGTSVVGQGTMYFRVDGAVAASVPMQADGTAIYQRSDLSLGQHTIQANYGTASGSNYDASSSAIQTLTINGDGPDLMISNSVASLSVKRGSASSATTVSVTSMNGAQGDVRFACSGLPMGAKCTFSPADISVSDGATVTTSMTVSTVSAASLASMSLLLLPFLGIGESRRRKALARSVMIGIVTIGALTGCGDTKNTYEIPTGTVQILVSATLGGITRTVPMSVTITE